MAEDRGARPPRTAGEDTETTQRQSQKENTETIRKRTQRQHGRDTEASVEKPGSDYCAQWHKGFTAGSEPAMELRAEPRLRLRETARCREPARRRRSIPYVGSTRASDASRGEAPPFSNRSPFFCPSLCAHSSP